jgi:hypothetical protein
MKIKSLLLGSLAAAGLSTGAYAADLGTMSSLDYCDDLGISGLTLSSDTNCLKITGGVEYEFNWGDWKPELGLFGFYAYDTSNETVLDDNGLNDWDSKVVSWVQFVATSDTDVGRATTVIKLKNEHKIETTNEVIGTDTYNVEIDRGYVTIGDATMLTAGKAGSIVNRGDDEPFNFLGTFHSSEVDNGDRDDNPGVGYESDAPSTVRIADGGHSIRVQTTVGDGFTLKGAAEKLEDNGTLVGVMEYSGETVSAHLTVVGDHILDGVTTEQDWALHSGITATLDQFKFRAAVAANDTGWWNGLVSGEASFDMFKLALSAEATSQQEYGFGGSFGADVTDDVTVNVGFRWFDPDSGVSNNEGWQAAGQLIAAVTETLKVTGEVGVYGTGSAATPSPSKTSAYASAELAWAPGGGFTSSVKGKITGEGGYKVTFKAAKAFE